jgi:Mn-dependent DtxR family transcriptional regulator
LLWVIANLPIQGDEFSVREIVERSKQLPSMKGFSSSHANQMLASLSDAGLVYKNRYGKYSFAVPLLDRFILHQGLN